MAAVALRNRQKHKMRMLSESDQDQMVVKSVSIPAGLEVLMEGLTKEVLSAQPQDICLFASRHFAKLIKIRETYAAEYKFCKNTVNDKIKYKANATTPNSNSTNPKDDVELIKAIPQSNLESQNLQNGTPVSENKTNRSEASTAISEDKTNRSEASTAEVDKLHAGFFPNQVEEESSAKEKINDSATTSKTSEENLAATTEAIKELKTNSPVENDKMDSVNSSETVENKNDINEAQSMSDILSPSTNNVDSKEGLVVEEKDKETDTKTDAANMVKVEQDIDNNTEETHTKNDSTDISKEETLSDENQAGLDEHGNIPSNNLSKIAKLSVDSKNSSFDEELNNNLFSNEPKLDTTEAGPEREQIVENSNIIQGDKLENDISNKKTDTVENDKHQEDSHKLITLQEDGINKEENEFNTSKQDNEETMEEISKDDEDNITNNKSAILEHIDKKDIVPNVESIESQNLENQLESTNENKMPEITEQIKTVSEKGSENINNVFDDNIKTLIENTKGHVLSENDADSEKENIENLQVSEEKEDVSDSNDVITEPTEQQSSKKINENETQEMINAASKIQSTWRGYDYRKRNKREVRTESDDSGIKPKLVTSASTPQNLADQEEVPHSKPVIEEVSVKEKAENVQSSLTNEPTADSNEASSETQDPAGTNEISTTAGEGNKIATEINKEENLEKDKKKHEDSQEIKLSETELPSSVKDSKHENILDTPLKTEDNTEESGKLSPIHSYDLVIDAGPENKQDISELSVEEVATKEEGEYESDDKLTETHLPSLSDKVVANDTEISKETGTNNQDENIKEDTDTHVLTENVKEEEATTDTAAVKDMYEANQETSSISKVSEAQPAETRSQLADVNENSQTSEATAPIENTDSTANDDPALENGLPKTGENSHADTKIIDEKEEKKSINAETDAAECENTEISDNNKGEINNEITGNGSQNEIIQDIKNIEESPEIDINNQTVNKENDENKGLTSVDTTKVSELNSEANEAKPNDENENLASKEDAVSQDSNVEADTEKKHSDTAEEVQEAATAFDRTLEINEDETNLNKEGTVNYVSEEKSEELSSTVAKVEDSNIKKRLKETNVGELKIENTNNDTSSPTENTLSLAKEKGEEPENLKGSENEENVKDKTDITAENDDKIEGTGIDRFMISAESNHDKLVDKVNKAKEIDVNVATAGKSTNQSSESDSKVAANAKEINSDEITVDKDVETTDISKTDENKTDTKEIETESKDIANDGARDTKNSQQVQETDPTKKSNMQIDEAQVAKLDETTKISETGVKDVNDKEDMNITTAKGKESIELLQEDKNLESKEKNNLSKKNSDIDDKSENGENIDRDKIAIAEEELTSDNNDVKLSETSIDAEKHETNSPTDNAITNNELAQNIEGFDAALSENINLKDSNEPLKDKSDIHNSPNEKEPEDIFHNTLVGKYISDSNEKEQIKNDNLGGHMLESNDVTFTKPDDDVSSNDHNNEQDENINNAQIIEKDKHDDKVEVDSNAPEKNVDSKESIKANVADLEKSNDNKEVEENTSKSKDKLLSDTIEQQQEIAAVKIQSAWRGTRVRRSLKNVNESALQRQRPSECDELPHQQGIQDDPTKLFKAAATIQAGIKGFLTRKHLSTTKSSTDNTNSVNLKESMDTSTISQPTVIEVSPLTDALQTDIKEDENKGTFEKLSPQVSLDDAAVNIPTNKISQETDSSRQEDVCDSKDTKTPNEADEHNPNEISAARVENNLCEMKEKETPENYINSTGNDTTPSKLPTEKKDNTEFSENIKSEITKNPQTLEIEKNDIPSKHDTVANEFEVNDNITNKEQTLSEEQSLGIQQNSAIIEANKKGINFNDFDSSKYDLKVEHKSPRSRSASPVSELSTAAYKIGAVIATNDDSIVNAIDADGPSKKERVEYIHIPLHGPDFNDKVAKIEEQIEKHKYSPVSANKKDSSKGDESSPEYIHIPLKEPGSGTQNKDSSETKNQTVYNNNYSTENASNSTLNNLTSEDNTSNSTENTKINEKHVTIKEEQDADTTDIKNNNSQIPESGQENEQDLSVQKDKNCNENIAQETKTVIDKEQYTKSLSKENASPSENNKVNIDETITNSSVESNANSSQSPKSSKPSSPIADIDAFLDRNKSRTIKRQEPVTSSSNRKLLDEVDSIIESYGQKRHMSPTTMNHSELAQTKINDDSTSQEQPLSIQEEPNLEGSHIENNAATKIQSTYRGYRTRKNLNKIDTNKPNREEDVIKERKNSSDTDKTYTIEKASPTNQSTPDEMSSDEETRSIAASKIQNSYRNYRRRRAISSQTAGNAPSDVGQAQNLKIDNLENKYLNSPVVTVDDTKPEELKDISEIAATKIQSSYRGFKTRQSLKNNNNLNVHLDTIPESVSLLPVTLQSNNDNKNNNVMEENRPDEKPSEKQNIYETNIEISTPPALGQVSNSENTNDDKLQNIVKQDETNKNNDGEKLEQHFKDKTATSAIEMNETVDKANEANADELNVNSSQITENTHTTFQDDGANNSSNVAITTHNIENQTNKSNDIIGFTEKNTQGSEHTTDEEVHINETQISNQTDVSHMHGESLIPTISKTSPGETDTSDGDLSDHKTSEDSKLLDKDESENTGRSNGTGFHHSGEMHDTIDIFLSSEELSQGAEKLTSRPATASHDRGDVETTAATAVETQAPNSPSSESVHHHSVMEAAEVDKKLQSQSATMGTESNAQEAATKIQAGFRGYQVRKQMKLKKNGSEDAKTVKRYSSGRRRGPQRRPDSQSVNAKTGNDLEERSATKIQAGIRGFLVRKRQKYIKDKQA